MNEKKEDIESLNTNEEINNDIADGFRLEESKVETPVTAEVTPTQEEEPELDPVETKAAFDTEIAEPVEVPETENNNLPPIEETIQQISAETEPTDDWPPKPQIQEVNEPVLESTGDMVVKKKNSLFIIFIIILLLVAAAAAVYFFFFKNDKESVKTTDVITPAKVETITADEMLAYLDSGIDELLLTETSVDDVQSLLKAKTDDVKIKFAIDLLVKNNKETTLANVNETLNTYFGAPLTANIDYVSSDNIKIYSYDENSQAWIKNEISTNNVTYPVYSIVSKEVSSSSDGILVTKNLISKKNSEIETNYYDSYTNATSDLSNIFSTMPSGEADAIKQFKTLCASENTFVTYKYTFIKSNNKLQLNKYEIK